MRKIKFEDIYGNQYSFLAKDVTSKSILVKEEILDLIKVYLLLVMKVLLIILMNITGKKRTRAKKI